jgi:hypothetical protein
MSFIHNVYIIISLILVNANCQLPIGIIVEHFSRNHRTDILYVSIMFKEIIFQLKT